MTVPDELENESVELVRPYVITNGRELPQGGQFELVTLVTVAPEPRRPGQLDPERRNLLELCAGGYLSVAEIAARMGLPIGVIRVLLSELAHDGYIIARNPVPPAKHLTDVQVLQEVLDGLHARFG